MFALEIGDVQFPVNALGHITAHEHTYKTSSRALCIFTIVRLNETFKLT